MRKILFLLSILFYFSCKNPCKEPNTIPFYRLKQDVEDFGVFQIGTYWVYQNDSTLQTDSVSVINTKRDTIPMDEDCEGVQYITIGTYEKFDATLSPSFLGGITLESQPDFVNLIGNLPYQDNIFILSDSGSVGWLDSLEFNGTTYYDVYRSRKTSSDLNSGDSTSYYSSRHYGIIRKQVFASSTEIESWSLIRSHIVQ